jgi:hypothetical protein
MDGKRLSAPHQSMMVMPGCRTQGQPLNHTLPWREAKGFGLRSEYPQVVSVTATPER